MLSEQFRRTDPRYDRRLSVQMLMDGSTLNAESINLSLGGMYLECESSLPEGATVKLRFSIPTQPEAVEVTGDVRWVQPTGPTGRAGMGIRFHGLRARDVWALNRFFQS